MLIELFVVYPVLLVGAIVTGIADDVLSTL